VKRLAPLLLIAIAAMVAPASALADVPAGSWQITGLVLDGKPIEAKGKLGFSDTGFGASVGCNTIGARASVAAREAGDPILTLTSDVTTTLIGCPADLGMAEDALLKILSGGPITMGRDKWTNAVGEIDVLLIDEGNGGAPAPGCIPPIAPGAVPPDGATVPCGNGGSGTGQNGSNVDPSGPTAAAPADPLLLPMAIGVGVLVVATIAVWLFLGPQRERNAGPED
jgi:hypothetical protein